MAKAKVELDAAASSKRNQAKTIAAKKEKVEATKEVAIREEAGTVAAAPAADLSAWGAAPISAKDIIIPRIMLQQPMSEMVTAGDAAFGDLVESLSHVKMGDFKKPLEVVPILMRKIFVEFDVTNGTDMKNKKFLRVVPITPANENLPYEDEENGVKIMRDYVREFFVLPVDELDAGAAMPYTISFRRSSANGGKQLATQMYMKNMNAGKTPASVVVEIAAEKTTSDGNTYATLQVKPLRPAKDSYVMEAFKWLQLINQGSARVDDSSYEQEAGGTEMPQASGPMNF